MTLGALVLAHFVVDWIFQTHWEAMRKHYDRRARAVHSTVYATGMSAAIWGLGSAPHLLGAWVWLWATHFVEDTYVPVYLWAKYIRRDPRCSSAEGFENAVRTDPLVRILAIVVDQLIHILCLLPLVGST